MLKKNGNLGKALLIPHICICLNHNNVSKKFGMLYEIFINQKAMAIKSFKPLKIHVALKTKEKGQKQQKTENVI